jgi:hypothetical protein
MTTLRQAAQMALEALEDERYVSAQIVDAITALRTALAQEHALHDLARLGQEIEQEPSQWRDMVVVSLVREGIDKHKARELADHFAITPTPAEYAQGYAEGFNDACKKPEQKPVAWAVQACSRMWLEEFAELDSKAEARRVGGTCFAYPLYTAPAQREWQSLTDEEVAIASAEFDLKSKMAYRAGMYKAQIILRKKNDSTY